MAYFYFDESIHVKAGFILGTWASFQDDPSDQIRNALVRAGLRPGIDEFKSSARMDVNPAQRRARKELRNTLENCRGRAGVVVGPAARRPEFGLEALRGLNKILSSNDLILAGHDVFFDQGLMPNKLAFEKCAEALDLRGCSLNIEQNSTQVFGLQVADFLAHSCAMMLSAQMGFIRKQVKAGKNSGYDPETEIDLAFELWASLRSNFFAADPDGPVDHQRDWCIDVASRGLCIAESCSSALRDAAHERFGTMYLGCIH